MPTLTYDELCLTTSAQLIDAVGNGEMIGSAQPTGLLSGLLSDENTANTTIINEYDKGDGKNHKVIIKYLQPDSESDSSDSETDFCEGEGSTNAYQWADVEADQYVRSRIMTLTEAQMRDFCSEDDNGAFRTKMLMGALNSVRRKVNAGLIPLYYANAGGIAGGNGAKGTAFQVLYRDNLLQVDPEGIIDMLQAYQDTGATGMPILAGGGNIKKYADMQGIACCNNLGVDASQLQDFMLFYDNQIDGILSNASEDDIFFAWAPGANVFVSRPKYKGQFRKISDTFIKDTIVDPLTGLEWDFNLKYDDCDEVYKWMISLNYGLFTAPSVYKSGDTRAVVNYSFAFKATEGKPA